MNLSLLAVAQLSTQGRVPAASPSPQAALEIARVEAFARVAATDRDGQTRVETLGNAKARRLSGDIRGHSAYGVGTMKIWGDPASGLVADAWAELDHSDERPSRPRTDAEGRPGLYPVPRLVSDDEACILAARYYAATGRPYGVRVYSIQSFGDNLQLALMPTYRGVPFSASVDYMEIDRETGEFDVLRIDREPPSPPASVVPGIAGYEAHLVALRAAAAGTPVRDYPTPHNLLAIRTLDPAPNPWTAYYFTPADHADAVAGRSRLVYDVRVQGTGMPYNLLVDARDGRLFQVRGEPLVPLAAGKAPPPAPFTPPSEPRPWRVAEGDAPWGDPVMSSLTPVRDPAFAPGARFLMTDGKVAFTAAYDAKRDLLGIETEPGKTTPTAPAPPWSSYCGASRRRRANKRDLGRRDAPLRPGSKRRINVYACDTTTPTTKWKGVTNP